MKRCLLMFGILLIVVIVASILENDNTQDVISEKLAMGSNTSINIIDTNK